jgi:hypothetical protein
MTRKKNSTRRDGRVLKRDVVPPNVMRQGEIVEEIVNNLLPLKDHKSREIVTAQVNKTLDSLLKLVPLQEKVFDRRVYRQGSQQC